MTLQHYSPSHKNEWDVFVQNAKNSHFFFCRDFMEYHKDRFSDYSLIFYDSKNRVIALLPACIKNSTVYTHAGLTFGGLVVSDRMTTPLMLDIFDRLKTHFNNQNITDVVYKCSPYIYHTKASEEDRYALFKNNATLIARNITSTIYLQESIRYSKGRKWSTKKTYTDVLIKRTTELSQFWELLTSVLQKRHNTQPVHSLQEIIYLISKFPKHIHCYVLYQNENLLAGALIFENPVIVHTQYLAVNDKGKEIGALDLLLDYLIKKVYSNKKYFDFGISNEQNGQVLNTGLITQKEGFDARAVACDIYQWQLSKSLKNEEL